MKKPDGIKRRDFLTGTAKGLAAAAVLPTLVPAGTVRAQDKPAPSERVVVGCIGTGDLGRRHHLANMLLTNPRVEVAAVCDVDRNHRDEAARIVKEKTGKRVGVYEDFRRLVDRKDINAVLIATPDHWWDPLESTCRHASLSIL